MEIESKSDDELLKIVVSDAKAFKDDFLSEVRLELYARGYNSKEGKWYQDENSIRIAELKKKIKQLESKIPQTLLLSNSFTSRAFAVFGHSLVANFLIAVPILIFIKIFS